MKYKVLVLLILTLGSTLGCQVDYEYYHGEVNTQHISVELRFPWADTPEEEFEWMTGANLKEVDR